MMNQDMKFDPPAVFIQDSNHDLEAHRSPKKIDLMVWNFS